MLAFLDAEYNANDERSDCSLIEIAMIAIKDLDDPKPKTLHKYVRPFKNNGELYTYIKVLTGITQSRVDNAGELDEALTVIRSFVRNKHIDKIIVWGNFDKLAFSKNFGYAHMNGRKQFCAKFYDFQKEFMEIVGVGMKESISLTDAAYVCGMTEPEEKHNALSDAQTLMELYRRYQKGIETEKIKELKRYLYIRRAYGNTKMNMNILKAMLNNGEEEIFKMLYNNEKFPPIRENPFVKRKDILKSNAAEALEFLEYCAAVKNTGYEAKKQPPEKQGTS